MTTTMANQHENAVSNMFKMELEPKQIFQHVVKINIISKEGREYSVSMQSKKSRGDRLTKMQDNFKIIQQVLTDAKKSTVFAYDGSSLLFATSDLESERSFDKEECMDLDISRFLKDNIRYVQCQSLEVSIKSEKNFNQRDMDMWTEPEFCSYLNILTSQDMLRREKDPYIHDTQGHLYPTSDEKVRPIGFAHSLWGFHKSCKVIEAGPTPVLEVDPTYTLMYTRRTVAELMQIAFPHNFLPNGEFNSRNLDAYLVQMLINGRCASPYLAQKNLWGTNTFIMKGWDLEAPKDEDYLTIHTNLRYPNYPAVELANGKAWPMEYLVLTKYQVLSGQVLEKFKLVPKAQPPNERYQKTIEMFKDLNTNNNKYLKAFGVKVVQNPIQRSKVEATRMLAPKVIAAGNKPLQVNDDKRDWRMAPRMAFAHPAKPFTIVAGVWQNNSVTKQDIDECQSFVSSLKKASEQKGLRVLKVIEKSPAQNSTWVAFLENLFETARRETNGIVIFFSVENSDMHDKLKLLEQRFDVPSQHVKIETVKIVNNNLRKDRPMTKVLDNILLKINMKLGGRNVGAVVPQSVWSDPNTLVFGIDVSHPKGAERFVYPSTVGLSCNAGVDSFSYVSDFYLVEPNKEIIDAKVLHAFVDKVTNTFIKKNGKPKRVLIFRDGVSGGQEAPATKEVDIITKRVEFHVKGKMDVLAFTVVKRHHSRFYQDSARVSNLKPETAIFQDISEYKKKQFFVMSANPIQGTAKIPSFTLLRNDRNVSDNEIIAICGAYCSQHQIVHSPTSLPTPLYVAHEMAKRGANLHAAYRAENPNRILDTDFENLTKKINYQNCARISSTRVV